MLVNIYIYFNNYIPSRLIPIYVLGDFMQLGIYVVKVFFKVLLDGFEVVWEILVFL